MKTDASHSSRVARYPFPGFEEALEAARYLQTRWRARPQVAITLGSGLEHVVRRVRDPIAVPYESIPHFPRPTVKGHGGTLHLGFWGKLPVAVLEGRVHLYEGFAPAQIVFPVRALVMTDIRVLVATCAAGGIARQARPGRLMIFSDHLNFQGANPLVGIHDARWGERFVDLTEAYDLSLRRWARRASAALRLRCFEGVYASVLGPSYETPAEIRALRRLGADAVGMSTVPEVIAARQLGARVLALAMITNRAAGLGQEPLSHEEVLQVGKTASRDLVRLLDGFLSQFMRGAGPR